MIKRTYELHFISKVKPNGTGVELLSPIEVEKQKAANDVFKYERFELISLCKSNQTYIAKGFDTYIVKIK